MMSRHVFHKIIPLLISAGILLPILTGFVHALHQHDHKICNSKVDQHVHSDQDDCTDLHYLIDLQSQDEIRDWNLNDPGAFNQDADKLVSLTLFSVQRSNSQRGPPTYKVL